MFNRLRNVGLKFRMKMKLVTGFEFYGQMLEIPDTSRVSNFLSARRYLRVSPATKLKPTDVAIINKSKYIIAEHGDGFYLEPVYKHFKLFEVDVEAQWSKVTKTKHPVTGVEGTTRTVQAGVIYLSMQPKNLISDSLNVPEQTYTAIANREVARNDVVNGLIVSKVDHVLGVWLLELKEN